MSNNYIHIEIFREDSHCEDCGSYSETCCRISSNIKSLNTKLGSASCCYLSSADLSDAIHFIFSELNIEYSFSKEVKDRAGEFFHILTFDTLKDYVDLWEEIYDENGQYVREDKIGIFDNLEYNNDDLIMLTELLNEKDITLTLEDRTEFY